LIRAGTVCAMSGTDEHPLPQRSRRILMLTTAVMAASAAAVLVLGTPDARLLRLGLLAALWAALLATFATARARREISSYAEHADQLRTVYQLELAREVAARREHTLRVERELREQAELSQRREIGELRTELAALRASLERLLDGNPRVERAEPACLLPLPAHPRKLDDGRGRAAPAATAVVKTAHDLIGPELRFGPGRPHTSTWGSAASPTNNGTANGQSNHRVPRSSNNGAGSHSTSSHHNGGGIRGTPDEMPTAAPGAQRTVDDLLAAHWRDPAPRRRHRHEDGPASSGQGVSRSS
jgi:hypothetical protein